MCTGFTQNMGNKIPHLFQNFSFNLTTLKLKEQNLRVGYLTQISLKFVNFNHYLQHSVTFPWPTLIFLNSTTFPGLESKFQIPRLHGSLYSMQRGTTNSRNKDLNGKNKTKYIPTSSLFWHASLVSGTGICHILLISYMPSQCCGGWNLPGASKNKWQRRVIWHYCYIMDLQENGTPVHCCKIQLFLWELWMT